MCSLRVAEKNILKENSYQGIRVGSLGLFLQCATSTFFSLIMRRLVRHFGSRWVYLSSMSSFTVSALVICLSKSVVVVTAMTSLTGYAYATLQTLPYTLTCHYHKEKEVYMPKRIAKNKRENGVTAKRDSGYLTAVREEEEEEEDEEGGGLNPKKRSPDQQPLFSPASFQQNGPPNHPGAAEPDEAESAFERRGVGLDFAILDSTFLLSQVFPSLFMGMIVQFSRSVTAYIACSAIFGAVAIYLANHIVFDQKDLSR